MFTLTHHSFVRRTATAALVVILLSALLVQPVYAAAAQLNAWTLISSNSPGNNSGTRNAGNLTVSAGSDRIFVVAVCAELDSSNTMSELDATLGTTALTTLVSTAGTNAQEHCYLGYLRNSQIPAGPTTLYVDYNVSGFSTDVDGLHVSWASYSGINQTTPFVDWNANYNAGASVTFGAQIDYVQNGLTFYAAANGGTPATMTPPAGFTQRLATTSNGHSSFAASITTAPHGANGNYPGATSVAFGGTTSSRSAIVVASLNPLIPITTLADATNPSSKTVGGLQTNQAVSAFTLATNSGTDTVTGLVVTGGGTGIANVAPNGVKIYRSTDSEWDAGDTLVGTASFSGTTATFTGLNIAVTTTVTRYIITYDIIASPTAGQTMTGVVFGATATNPVTNTDTVDATLTVGYIITSTAGPGGTITATMIVADGATPTFYSVPNTGYIVADVLVDGISVQRANTYTFSAVHANHTISVTFDGGPVGSFQRWYQPSLPVGSGSGWTNTANGFTSDNSYATSNSFPGSNANYINFSIPAIPLGSVINGIEVAYEGYTGNTNANVALSGDLGSSFAPTGYLTTFIADVPDRTVVLGGPTNTWGSSTWAYNDFTNGEFYLRVSSDNYAQLYLDQIQVRVHYTRPSGLTVVPATGTYGGTVDLTATLLSNGAGVVGETITFTLNGTTVGTGVTDVNGVATLNAASLLGIDANTYPTGVGASFAGSSDGVTGYAAASDTDILTVNQRVLTVSATGINKIYDGNANATVTLSDDRVSGDVLTVTYASALFDDKNIGTGKQVSVTGINVTGAKAANYTWNTTADTTADITTRALTVTATGVNKVYDGNNIATVILSDNRVAGDVLTLAYASALFDNENVGNTKPVNVTGITVTGTDAGNYTFNDTAATTANITKRLLTITATGVDKVYDGTTSATAILSDDRVPGDDLTLSYSIAMFDNPNVGMNKPVAVVGISIAGTDAGNYDFNSTATTSANITGRPLTVTATGIDKVYDGNTNATVTLSDNRIPGDVLTLNYGSASFDDKNVGTGKLVTVIGITVTGSSAGNYTWNTTATTTADITARALTVTATGINKVYDGNTDATVNLLDNRVAGDVLTLAYASASFDTPDVGTGKTVSVSGITISGTDAGNYTFNTTATTTADITPRALMVTATGINKVYDGTTGATVTLSDDRVPGDTLILNYANANFDNKNVGTGKVVMVVGITVSGADAGNYTYNNTAFTTADITARALTVTATGIDKMYDGTTDATVTLSDNRVPGDVLTLGYASANFDTPDVGANKPVTVTGITVTGSDASNYTWNTTATTTADITLRLLTISATGINKVYDGNTNATVTLSDDRVPGDIFSVNYANATFDTKDVGTGKTVTVTGITITGPDAYKYTFNNTATTTADITARALTVGATGINKVYDGTTDATVTLSDDGLAGDTLILNYASATFDTKDVGTNKLVTVTGITVTGADAGNYTWNATTTTTADITGAALAVSATGIDKVYDGNTNATVTLSHNGSPTDILILNYANATFDTKEVGTGKTVTVTGITVTGADAGNYTWNTTTTTTADITARVLVVTATGINKVYDGTTAATVTLSDNGVAGDILILNYASASFDTPDVGIGKTVTVTGITVTGPDAGNYTFNTGATTTADITARTITVTAVTDIKTYDGDTSSAGVPIISSGTLAAGDTANFIQTFDTKDVGTGKTLTPSGTVNDGNGGNNYAVTFVPVNTGQIIAGNVLTVTGITANNKVYDGNTVAALNMGGATLVGVQPGDVVTLNVAGAVGTFDNKNVGTGKTVTVSGLTIGGPDAGNYGLAQPTTTADITLRTLTVTATGNDKVYNGNTIATVTLSDDRVPGDVLTVTYASASFADKHVGNNKTVSVSGINVTGADAGNYTFNTTDSTTANITARPITVSAVADTKVYDSTTASSATPSISAGTLATGDTASFIQTFDTKDIGTNKTLTPSGTVNDGNGGNNYAVTFVDNTNGTITGITLTISGVTANNRVYDGTTVAPLNTAGAALVGVVPGDDVTLNTGGATGVFATKNVGPAKPVTVSGFTITGTDIGNYTLVQPTGLTANVTGRSITVSAVTNTKVYDSTTASANIPAITSGSIAAGDTANFTQMYDTPNVGTSKILTPTGSVADGNGGGNYLVTFANNSTGVITARPITVTADPKAKAFGAPDPAFTYSLTSGSLVGGDSFSGSLTRVAGENVGTYAILRGSLTAGSNYNLTYVGANLTIANVNQTITVITHAPATATYGTNFNVAATASSSLPVLITTTGVCTGSGSTTATIIMGSGTGACTVHFNQPGDANFSAAIEVTETAVAQKANQVITVNTPAPATAAYNSGFNVAATASSGLTVSYTSSGVCTNAGSSYTVRSGTGTCTVLYDQAGNDNYNAAPQVTQTVNAIKADQTISVTTSAPANAAYGSSFTVAATASSSLPVSYNASGACTNAGTTYTMTAAAGACSVQYDQAGNDNYNAAPQVTQNVNAQKANQTITVTTSAPPTASNGDIFTVAATASSSLPVAITTSGACTGSGSGSATVTMTSGTGACTVFYNQSGDTYYNTAAQVTEAVNSQKADQTITVTTPAPATAGNGASFTVAATASSSLPVAITTSGICTGSGTDTATITMTGGTGSCTVMYNQSGNANYNPAPQVIETVIAGKADQTITIITHAPATASNSSSFTVVATASSSLLVSYSSAGACTNVGQVFTMTSGTGICTVKYDQAGDANYNPAPQLTETVVANLGPAITSANNATFDVGILGTFTVTTAGNPVPAITMTGTLPTGVTITDNGNGTALLTGTPANGTGGIYDLVITASNGVLPNAVQNFTLTVNRGPSVVANGVNTVGNTGDGHLDENEIATVEITKFLVTFSKDVNNPAGNKDPHDVTNPANYILVRDNGDGIQTSGCVNGVVGNDIAVTLNSIMYTGGGTAIGPFVATLTANGGTALPDGSYRFIICGSTSITDKNGVRLAGNGTTEGTDFIRNFVVYLGGGGGGGGGGDDDGGEETKPVIIPATGFPMGKVTPLPEQSADDAYTSYGDLWLEIPRLGVEASIVGVPKKNGSWDVSWLWDQAGYLEGSAFPTWSGNSVLTSHVYLSNGKPGPFVSLNTLTWGDQIIIHAYGQEYVYEVRSATQVKPNAVSTMLKHEDLAWLTLVTCRGYNESTDDYQYRVLVRAVLVKTR